MYYCSPNSILKCCLMQSLDFFHRIQPCALVGERHCQSSISLLPCQPKFSGNEQFEPPVMCSANELSMLLQTTAIIHLLWATQANATANTLKPLICSYRSARISIIEHNFSLEHCHCAVSMLSLGLS